MSYAKPMMFACLVIVLAAAGWFWYSQDSQRPADNGYSVLLQDGIGHFDQERYSEALETLQKIPPARNSDWRVPYYVGSAYMMLKDYQQATQALEQALALDSGQPGVLYALGVCYYKQGKLGLAKGYFSAVLEITPNDEHAKGLMDIMSRLERPQSDQDQEQGSMDNDGGKSGRS